MQELNSDWTASQELADGLMCKYKLPFRVGHHFTSEVVSFAKKIDIKPLDFPYAEAQRIYREAVKDYQQVDELPMNAEEFRSTLNPARIVNNRVTVGGPQPPELERMLKLAEQDAWLKEKRDGINTSQANLDADFAKLLNSGN